METKNSQPVTAGGAGAEPPSLASAPKSLADIMAEMRRGTKLPGYWSSSALNKILAYHADRIEAAAKRESSGNTAAMREALEAARDLLLPQCNGGTAFAKACGKTVNKIMDALSAPPRNCDRSATLWDAICAWGCDDQGWVDWPDADVEEGDDNGLVNILTGDQEHELLDWLFAPAEPETEGVTDENK